GAPSLYAYMRHRSNVQLLWLVSAVPPLLFSRMSSQVSARVELLIVEVGIEVLRLKVIHDPHRGHSAREFSKCLIDVLGLGSEKIHELVVERRRRTPHRFGFLPRSGRARIKRSACAELPFGQRLDHFPHRSEMRPCI